MSNHVCRYCDFGGVFEDRICPGCGRSLPGPAPRENVPSERAGQIVYLQVPTARHLWLKDAARETGLSMAEIQRGALALLMQNCAEPGEARAYLNAETEDLVAAIAAS